MTSELTANTKNEPEVLQKRKRRGKKKVRPLSMMLRLLVWISAAITFAVLIFLVAYILVRGVPYLSPSLFEWTYNSENVSEYLFAGV